MLFIGSADEDAKRTIRRAPAERGLSSHMNDAKWRALCLAVAEELPFPPAYQTKLVLSEQLDPEELPLSSTHGGDWARTPEASMGIFIEWLKITLRLSIREGRLLKSRTEDCSDLFRQILIRLRIPFTEEDGFFFIFGHSAGTVFSPMLAPSDHD